MQIEIKQQIDSRVKLILELESQGIPIDWKQLTLQIYNTIMAEEKEEHGCLKANDSSELLGDVLFGDD